MLRVTQTICFNLGMYRVSHSLSHCICCTYETAAQVTMLMDLVCKSCGELMEDAVKNNMRIRVLASDRTKVSSNIT